MRGKNKADLKKLMSVSDSIAELNLGRFRSFLGSTKVEEGSPAAGNESDIARPAVSGSPGSTPYPTFPCEYRLCLAVCTHVFTPWCCFQLSRWSSTTTTTPTTTTTECIRDTSMAVHDLLRASVLDSLCAPKLSGRLIFKAIDGCDALTAGSLAQLLTSAFSSVRVPSANLCRRWPTTARRTEAWKPRRFRRRTGPSARVRCGSCPACTASCAPAT